MKKQRSNRHYVCLPFCWSWPGVWDIFQKEGATEKEGVEIEDWGTSAHLSWSLKNISCKPCLLFYCSFIVLLASKSSIPFHSLITEFFWFTYLWFRIAQNIHNKPIACLSRKGGVLEVVLPRREQKIYLREGKFS